MKAILEAKGLPPLPAKSVTRDTERLDWKEAFVKHGYHLDRPVHSTSFGQSMRWYDESGKYVRSIDMGVVFGDDHADARQEVMGFLNFRSSAPLIPDRVDIMKDGPGDLCVAGVNPHSEEYRHGKRPYELIFVRDQVGVVLKCGAEDVDLLPIARVLDRVIQACPEKQK